MPAGVLRLPPPFSSLNCSGSSPDCNRRGRRLCRTESRKALEEVRERGLACLLALAGSAVAREDFRQACNDRDFSRYVTASLPLPLAKQWASIVLKDTSVAVTLPDARTENSLP